MENRNEPEETKFDYVTETSLQGHPNLGQTIAGWQVFSFSQVHWQVRNDCEARCGA